MKQFSEMKEPWEHLFEVESPEFNDLGLNYQDGVIEGVSEDDKVLDMLEEVIKATLRGEPTAHSVELLIAAINHVSVDLIDSEHARECSDRAQVQAEEKGNE